MRRVKRPLLLKKPRGSEEVAEASGDPVHVGALLPLSEPGAPQAGQLILRGIELAAEYVNTELGGSVDGRPVEIVVEDDKGTPEVGASGYRRLVQEKNIIGATGCYHSSVCLAVIEVAKELGRHTSSRKAQTPPSLNLDIHKFSVRI